MKNISYTGYLLRHKLRVFVHATILGVPLRGLLHDLSKFHPVEWKGIGRQFYPHTAEEKEANASLFRQAKAHHRERNRHEVDHWCLEDGTCAPIPTSILKEIMADWAAFSGLCLSRPAICDHASRCYLKWGRNYRMHPETRKWIEGFLRIDVTGNCEPAGSGDA
jgi:hypothetical protein